MKYEMSDIILETIRAILVGVIFVYLFLNSKNFISSKREWIHILWGFGLLLFASFIDITDNFESLSRFVVIGDTDTQAFLEKVVGYLGGFSLLAIGFKKWLPKVNQLHQAQQKIELSQKNLKEANKDIKKRAKELEKAKNQLEKRNEELERMNELMTGRELKMIELKKKLK